MGTDVNTATGSDFAQDRLGELKAKYEASKVQMEIAKENKLKYESLYTLAKSKYATSDPSKVDAAKYAFQQSYSSYNEADCFNTYLNHEYFSATLRYGGMDFIG